MSVIGLSLRKRLVSFVIPLNGLRSLIQLVWRLSTVRFVSPLYALMSVIHRFFMVRRVRPVRFCIPERLSNARSGSGHSGEPDT